MNVSSEPESYRSVMELESKRYSSAMEESSESIMHNSISPENEEDNTLHADHLDRTSPIHILVKIMSSIFWTDYLLNGLGEMLTLYDVDDYTHKLLAKPISNRSQLEKYSASLRSFLKNSAVSFLTKTLLSNYGLGEVQASINILVEQLNSVLKYSELTFSMLEKYLTYIEHGAKLAAAYINADSDENEQSASPSDLYDDIRVRAYAYLRVSDLDPSKMAKYIEDISNLVVNMNGMIDIVHHLYTNITPASFENIFNALTSKKTPAPPSYDGTKFENIHEINEYIRQHMEESLNEPQGFMYTVNELLEEARMSYIDKLATEITEILAFIPTKKDQERFIGQFESGKIWLSENHGE